ncbi:2970_t:CDS:1, partial [Scutellospora calospora]
FTEALNDATNKLTTYFWECPYITKETKNKQFEFVVTKCPELKFISQDYSSFEEYINKNDKSYVCSFSSLGKDATLIIPVPQEGLNYKNLSNITKNASKEQQIKFWKEVVNKLAEGLEIDAPQWLST